MEDLKKFIHNLAKESAKIIKPYFRTKLSVDSKADDSPVTIADKKAEEIMRELIMKEYPEHGIIGEEFGSYKEDADYKWILDPIDGTKSFICGAVNFGTLICLMRNNEPLLGVINNPILDDFLVGDNISATINDEPARIRKCEYLSDAILLTGDHLTVCKYQDRDRFENLTNKVKLYRNLGDCYGYYLLATGFVDIMIDPIMSPWDIMALIPVIKGAGGVITDYNGNDPVSGNSIIASTSNIHSKVIEILNTE